MSIFRNLQCDVKAYPSQILKLPQSSLCELARNSVIQSGFEMQIKRHWLGHHWYLPGAAGNDINKVRLGLSGYHVPYTNICIADKRPQSTSEVQARDVAGRVGFSGCG